MIDLLFFIEVLVGGLLSGIMYSLVALGFVLIYKASSVFNFAQGAMVFFAVLSFVGFMELGLPFWAALPVTVGLMVLVGMATERFVLRPLVNQSENTLLMATIGLAFVIEGTAQLAWGVDVRRLDLGIRDVPIGWLADNAACSSANSTSLLPWSPGSWWRRWRCCSRAPRSVAGCGRSPTTMPPRCRSAFR